MAQTIIPLNPLPNQDVRVVLSGSTYYLQIRYNTRLDTYTLNVQDANRAQIATGIRLVINYSLLSRIVDERKPPGKLFAIDTSGAGADCGFNDLGRRVLLAYDG
jgi:hypothetical protein